MKKLLTIILALSAMSCTVTDRTAKVKVLENGTMTYADLTHKEVTSLSQGDTVWLNLSTHRIDNVDTTAMLVRIEYINFP